MKKCAFFGAGLNDSAKTVVIQRAFARGALLTFCVIVVAAVLGVMGFQQARAVDDSSGLARAIASISTMSYQSVSYPEGGTYKGAINRYAEKEGQGTYKWSNGDSYKGAWQYDMMDGRGVYTFANGATLRGRFEADEFTSGVYQAKIKKNTYRVSVKKGSPYKAVITTAKGVKYTGAFHDGKIHGKGTMTYPSGAKYSGSYRNGKRSGTGTYTWKNKAKYKGKWKNDAMSGKGTYYYPAKYKAKSLSGTFSKNKPTGTCVYKLKSGKTYKTVWKNGKCVGVR